MRGKFLSRGAGALEDDEILEVIFMAFVPRRDVKPVAEAFMTRFGSLSGILAAPGADLIKVAGNGETVAACLKAVAEVQSRAAREEIRRRPAISSWSALIDHVRVECSMRYASNFASCSRIAGTSSSLTRSWGTERSSMPGLSA